MPQAGSALADDAAPTSATKSMKQQADWLLQAVSRFKLRSDDDINPCGTASDDRDRDWGRIETAHDAGSAASGVVRIPL